MPYSRANKNPTDEESLTWISCSPVLNRTPATCCSVIFPVRKVHLVVACGEEVRFQRFANVSKLGILDTQFSTPPALVGISFFRILSRGSVGRCRIMMGAPEWSSVESAVPQGFICFSCSCNTGSRLGAFVRFHRSDRASFRFYDEFSSNSSALVNAQIATALAGGALPPWLATSPRPEGNVPVAFLIIYQKLLQYDGGYRI